jgi:hypothetical protein
MRLPSALLLLCACGQRPQDHLSWSEGWELVALTGGDGLVSAGIGLSNTGLLRGQGQSHFTRWSTSEGGASHRRVALPEAAHLPPDRGSVQVGTDLLQRKGRVWDLHQTGDGFQVRLQVQGPDWVGAVPDQAWFEGGGEWRLEATLPVGRVEGWLEAGSVGGRLEGPAVLLHRGGDGRPAGPRRAVYLLSGPLRGIYEEHGQGRMAALWSGEQALSIDLARLGDRGADGAWELHIEGSAPQTLRLLPTGEHGDRMPLEHLLSPERWLARRLGHDLLDRLVVVRVEGSLGPGRGVLRL